MSTLRPAVFETALARRNGAWLALWPALGFIVWGTHFLVIYCTAAVVCERGLAGLTFLGYPVPRITTALATAGALVILAAIIARASLGLRGGADPLREPRVFSHFLALMTALLSALAVLLNSVPAFTLPLCG